MSHIQYLQFTTIQYNSTSFISNIEHDYITVIVEVVCLNMFFYDWSNINRYSRTTMQHVTAVKIGGGGGQALYNEVLFYGLVWLRLIFW